VFIIPIKAEYAEIETGRYAMRVGTGLKAGGIIQDATDEAGKTWNRIVIFVNKADNQAAGVVRDALDGTTVMVNWLADLLNRL
jgi:hypothetical protein